MTLKKLIERWPVLRQAAGDPLGLGRAVRSQRTQSLRPRTGEATWERTDEQGRAVNRTQGIAHLGGATLDNEENYLIKKLFTAGLGMVSVEKHARTLHNSTGAGL